LGIFDFGKYAMATPDKEYAFVRIQEMWNEPVNDSDSDDETQANEHTNRDTNDEELIIT
jgi:hypothetical protein